MRNTAKVVRIRPPQPILLDDGPEAIAFVAAEIRISNLNYLQIAERADVHPHTVSKIASGDTKLPRWMSLVKIARVLGWSIYAQHERR